jgi:hypothetical protein
MIILLTNAKPYSPITTLAASLLTGATTTTLTNITICPVVPFYMVITSVSNINYASNNPDDYETILVEGIDGSNITSITRGIEGLEQNWNSGDYIAVFFTAVAFDDLWEGINSKLNLSGGTMTGSINFKGITENVNATSGNGTVTIDITNGRFFKHSIVGGNIILEFSGTTPDKYCEFLLSLKMDSTDRSVTWPSSIRWEYDLVPDLPTSNLIANYTFYTINNGTRWYGFQNSNNTQE